MTDTQTTEAIQKHLDEQPTDWIARLQLADLLEDAGRMDEAKMQRWMVQWKHAPLPFVTSERLDVTSFSDSTHGMVRALNHTVWHWYPKCYYGTRKEAEDSMMQLLVATNWPNG